MSLVETVLYALFSPDNFWGVVGRGVLWFVIAGVIIASSDSPDQEKSAKSLKKNLGFIFMFVILSGGLFYLLFGFAPTPA